MEKMCCKCKITKPISSFHRDLQVKRKYGVRSDCKECVKKRQETYRTKEYVRDRNLRDHFGITSEDYNRMLIEQNGKCKICGSTTPNSKQFSVFSVDHDHSTGKIRGLLCTSCNRMLGFAHDNIQTLEKAIRYLQTMQVIEEATGGH